MAIKSIPTESAVAHGGDVGRLGFRGVREMIPTLGLREYWYPALEAWRVRGKPVGLKMLGEQVVFFRGTDGKVKALNNVCPHRGGSLMHGDSHFPGIISCPYHGWTYDDEGTVLAVLPKGPDSKIPGKVGARAYPTQTLRGMVFVWMGATRKGVKALVEDYRGIVEAGDMAPNAYRWEVD